MRIKRISLFAVLVLTCASARAATREPIALAAMRAMQAPCAAFTMDLRRELGLLSQPGTAVGAGARTDASPTVGRDRGLAVTLTRQGSVMFAQPPANRRGGPESYAGLVSLGVLPKGEWRVSADRAVWFDLVSGGRMLESPTFEMQAGCPELRKSVVFVQPSDAPAWLQISGGTEADVRIVVTSHSATR